MARMARVVVPGIPHHVTQRGNRRQATFFGDDDYAAYLDLMAQRIFCCGWSGSLVAPCVVEGPAPNLATDAPDPKISKVSPELRHQK